MLWVLGVRLLLDAHVKFNQEDGETCSQGRNQMSLCAKFKQQPRI